MDASAPRTAPLVIPADPSGGLRPERTPGHLIRRAQQSHGQFWAKEIGGDLTGPQYAILSAIDSRPGIDQQAAGELASLDRSTAADVIARLERNAWLTRDRDANDGRRSLLNLTAPSRSALEPVTRAVREVQRRLLGVLDADEQRELVVLLGRVAYEGAPPPSRGVDGGSLLLALPTTPGHLLRRAEQVHQRGWSTHVEPPLTPSQYAVLCVLGGGALDQATVGTEASLDRSSTTDILARMRRRGWVEAVVHPDDRRRRCSSLTPSALALLATATPAAARVQADLLAPLAEDETDRFVELLRRVAYR